MWICQKRDKNRLKNNKKLKILQLFSKKSRKCLTKGGASDTGRWVWKCALRVKIYAVVWFYKIISPLVKDYLVNVKSWEKCLLNY